MPAITIRPATEQDLPRVDTLCIAAYTGDYVLPEGYVATLGQAAARAQAADIFVAERGGALVGTVTVNRPGRVQMETTIPGEVDFRMLAVDPTVRRAGVARALVDFVVQVARDRQAPGIFLVTGPIMVAAQQLYARLGFRRVPGRDIPLPDGVTVLWAYEITADEYAAANRPVPIR